MRTQLKKYICRALLVSTALINATSQVAPLIRPRSRSVDTALELVGWTNHTHLYDKEGFYSTFAATVQYDRTFRPEKTIAPALFGDDLINCDCPTINISGKCYSDRTSQDWLADNFGLPQDFKSCVTFAPRVDSASVDFNLYVGLNEWYDGMYLKIHAPVEHVRYSLGYSEQIIEKGSLAHEEGYFSDAEVPRENLLDNFEDYVNKCRVPDLNGVETVNDTNISGNVEFEKLNCARMLTCGRLTKTRLSDLQVALGWDFLQDHDYHLGVEFRFAAPTGNRPEGNYLFEPIVGNGHHWEVGGGVNGHVLLWEREDQESHFGLWFQANVTHLLKTRQRRFFDLTNAGGNSRYMLAAKMTSPAVNLFASTDPLAANPTPSIPSAQFARVFRPVANLTCCDVDVSIGVQGDVSAMFNYTYKGCSWDIGYNFWGRSCEKIELNCKCPCPLEREKRTWVLKGDAHVIGFSNAATANQNANNPIALSASDSKANLHAGSNVPVGNGCNSGRVDPADTPAFTAPDTRRNQNIDNAQFAFETTGLDSDIHFRRGADVGNDGGNNQTNTSNSPVFLTVDDVDMCAAETKGRSHKIFTHISYTWMDLENWEPYIGFGAKVEFSKSKECCPDTSCKPAPTFSDRNPCSFGSDCGSCSYACESPCRECLKCNFSEWGIWLKGGVSFD